MRYSLEHKAQNHENILAVAARSFRECGGDSSGIGRVMKQVGLTKGGFYRHFQSKDDLLVAAVARAFDEMGSGMVEVARSAPAGQALRAIIEGCSRCYLNPLIKVSIYNQWLMVSARQIGIVLNASHDKKLHWGAQRVGSVSKVEMAMFTLPVQRHSD